MPASIVERYGGKTFLDSTRSAAILDFINLLVALPLAPEKLAKDRRPAQHRRMSEVNDIVETVTVGRIRVVRQVRTALLAVHKELDDLFRGQCPPRDKARSSPPSARSRAEDG